jgi:hypothetical protein
LAPPPLPPPIDFLATLGEVLVGILPPPEDVSWLLFFTMALKARKPGRATCYK